MDFQGKFGYSCVFGDMLVSYSFAIWPSKALLEKPADHCGVGIFLDQKAGMVGGGNRNGMLRSLQKSLCTVDLIHSLKLTYHQKRDYFNRKYIFQPLIFRGQVNFRGCSF